MANPPAKFKGEKRSFTAALVYRRAVGDGSASNPLGDAAPIPGATRAGACGLAVNKKAALVYRRAVGDGSPSNPLSDAVPIPGATRASTFALNKKTAAQAPPTAVRGSADCGIQPASLPIPGRDSPSADRKQFRP